MPGGASISRPELFYPRGGEMLVSRAGTYRLALEGTGPEGRAAATLSLVLPNFCLPELADGRLIRLTPASWEPGRDD